MSKTFAQLLSYILHPAIIPTVGAAFLLWVTPVYVSNEQFLYILGFMFIATYLLPALFSVLLKAMGVIQSLHMKDPKDRKYPFLVSITFFLFAANSLQPWENIPVELPLLLISSAITIFIFYTVLRWTKLSVHLAGMGGLVATLIFASGKYEIQILGLIALGVALSGILASARLKLKAHTPFQVILGFSVAFAVTISCLQVASVS